MSINPNKLQSTWYGQLLVDIANYKSNPENHPILVKIGTDTGTDQFIGFNDATGVIRQNDEADNEVMLVETTGKGERASQSFLKVHLQEGKSYVYTNWADTGKDLIVKANKIFTDDSNGSM